MAPSTPSRRRPATAGPRRIDIARLRWRKAVAEPRAIQRYLCRKAFPVAERAGIHVVGDHFYEPVPNLAAIASGYDDDRRPCHGLDLREAEAEELLLELLDRWAPHFAADAEACGFTHRNLTFAGVDPVTLYAWVREHQPRTIVEIGQGTSTTVLLAALQANATASRHDERPRLITVDPYLRIDHDLADTAPDVDLETHTVALQELTRDLITGLEPGSLLFIDSSHVHKWGSDVATLFDHVLPCVAIGTTVHLHDIYTPFDYPRDWYVKARRFWNEQFVLESFLAFNAAFEISLPVQLMVRTSQRLGELWPRWSQLGGTDLEGSSFYVRRVG